MLTFGITRKTLKLFLYGLFVGYPRWQPLVAALFYPDLVGRLPVTWKDYDGNTYLIVLEDVLYFPRCPVSDISVTSLANQLDDDYGTSIKTSRNMSKFVWNRKAGKVDLFHGPCQPPEMLVNEGFQHSQKTVLASLLSKYDSNECC